MAVVACAVAIPAAPQQPRPISPAEDLAAGAEDLKSSSSYGYGYYGGYGYPGLYGGYGSPYGYSRYYSSKFSLIPICELVLIRFFL